MFTKRMKVCFLTLALLIMSAITGVKAGSFTISKVSLVNTKSKSVTKTTDTGKLSVNAKCVEGSPRPIIVWAYNSSQTKLLTNVVAYENGGTVSNTYSSNKAKGTNLKILWRDYKGGIGFDYSTSANVNYY